MRGGISKDGTKWYGCANYREGQNKGDIIADLYDDKGEFHRAAIVAKVHPSEVVRYCNFRNRENDVNS